MKYKDIRRRNKKGRIIIWVILVLLSVVLVASGCLIAKSIKKEKNDENSSPQISVVDAKGDEDSTGAKPQEDKPKSNNNTSVERLIADMTLSEKIYQMMFVTPESITGYGTVIQAGEATKQALEKYPVGGLIYFASNLQNREQTSQMISKSQSYSKIPLFIGVDEEGGRVARLGDNPYMGTTQFPPMAQIGQSGNSQKAYEIGATLAKDLSALGFNVNFAPDADVLVNSGNTEIGDRSFGSDPILVAEMVAKEVQGLQNGGVSATLKHFPGHGSTYLNSHSGYSESTRTVNELRSNEFLPFVAGIKAGADFVMVSHMTLVNATEEKVPSSVSKEVITNMLIEELGYSGIIITDSFAMGAVTDMYSPAKAALKAIEAGADMILMTPDINSAHNAILSAVESGQIPQSRIDKSVRKILSLKEKKLGTITR